MPKIDIEALLSSKAPRVVKYVPKFIIRKLSRIIHQDELNYILTTYNDLAPQEFIQACFREWNVTYSIEGLERLPKDDRYLFVSNHPFGGMDGMMIADELIKYFGDARVVVNDLLMNLEPLKPIWIPVNKHGGQSTEYVKKFGNEFMTDLPILTFPAGLCSRCIDGVITDLQWKSSFLKRAQVSNRKIVPIFVEGELSKFFYRVSKLRKFFGIKFNIEMLWLSDEMFSQGGKHFRIIVGDPIELSELNGDMSIKEQVEFIRKKTYFLKNRA